MPNYQDGKVYMIWSTLGSLRYYGSTCRSLSARMSHHRSAYRNGADTTSAKIFNEYGVNNCKIELVDNYPCTSKEELDAVEGFYIRNNECVNRIIIGRTPKEYYEDHKEELKENYKKYYDDRKKNILDQKKKYYEEHKEELKAKQRERYANKKTATQ